MSAKGFLCWVLGHDPAWNERLRNPRCRRCGISQLTNPAALFKQDPLWSKDRLL